MASQATGGKVTSVNDVVVNNTMGIGKHHTLIISGGASAQNISLQGSGDGITWFNLTLTAASTGATVTTNAATSNGIYVSTSTVPLQFVRALLNSITGGPQTISLISAD